MLCVLNIILTVNAETLIETSNFKLASNLWKKMYLPEQNLTQNEKLKVNIRYR